MARCSCSSTVCSCLILGGEGVDISGSGTATNPYVIHVEGASITGKLTVNDTPTLNLNLLGAGTTSDPLILSGTARTYVQPGPSATVSTAVQGQGTNTDPYVISSEISGGLGSLGDVNVETDPPDNYVLAWDGEQWVAAPPNLVDPGALLVGAGLSGLGVPSSPLALDLARDDTLVGSGGASTLGVHTAGVWGSGELVFASPAAQTQDGGLPVYADSTGALRVPRGVILDQREPNEGLFNNGYLHLGTPTENNERGYMVHRKPSATGIAGNLKLYVTAYGGNLPEYGLLIQRADTAQANRSVLYHKTNGNVHVTTVVNGVSTARPIPFGMAYGFVTLAGAANTVRSVTVTYPVRRFLAVPATWATPHTMTASAGATNTEFWTYNGSLTTSFTVGVNRSNTTNVGMQWLAIQLQNTVQPLSAVDATVDDTTPFLAAQWEQTQGAYQREAVLLEQESYVQCQTPHCENEGVKIAVEATVDDGDGNQVAVDEYVCGVCQARLVLGGGVLPTVIELG